MKEKGFKIVNFKLYSTEIETLVEEGEFKLILNERIVAFTELIDLKDLITLISYVFQKNKIN